MSEANPSTSRLASLREKNVMMLLEKLKELQMSTDTTDSRIFGRVEGLLRKEVDKLTMSQYDGLECNSDEEINEAESDDECFSDSEAGRKTLDYDLDTMFEIVNKRDFHKWNYATIYHKHRKISNSPYARVQIHRMRNYVRRGSISSRTMHAQLREAVWNEVYTLDKEGVVLHNVDIQYIAMLKAQELNLHNFQASDGWVYYFKKKYNFVDRHIDKVVAARPPDDETNLDELVNKFKNEQMPIIMAYALNKIWNADQMGIQMEIPPGRTLTIRGTKKVVRFVQRINATTHSYTVHIQLSASGKLAIKLPIVDK